MKIQETAEIKWICEEMKFSFFTDPCRMIESDLFYEQSPHGIHDGHDKDACIGKMAIHILARPNAPKIRTITLIPMAK